MAEQAKPLRWCCFCGYVILKSNDGLIGTALRKLNLTLRRRKLIKKRPRLAPKRIKSSFVQFVSNDVYLKWRAETRVEIR